MNYPEELREKYNEVMYDERDIIEKFLKDQYDLRYGHQRDTWHFEPAVELVAHQGSHVLLHDIKLDKSKIVVFYVEAFCDKNAEWECFDFAYGELSKVIEALPDADEIVKENAINDIAAELELSGNIVWSTGQKHIIGDGFDVLMVTGKGYDAKVILRKCDVNSEPIMLKNLSTTGLKQLRDHINIESLHSSDEYKRLKKILSCEANLAYEPANYDDVLFTIVNTDMEVDLLSASLDANEKMTLWVRTENDEEFGIEEKDIKKEYLEVIISHIESTCDIIDTYNGHNPELVRKINDAWRDDRYHDNFEGILHALLERDYEEYCDKFEVPEVTTSDYAMNHAHEIMEGVCDDQDLQTILSFIRYKL